MCGPGPSGGMCRDVGPHRSDADNVAAGVETRSTMISAIGTMHIPLRTKKRPEDDINFSVEMKKRGRRPEDDEDDAEDDRTRRSHAKRGLTT